MWPEVDAALSVWINSNLGAHPAFDRAVLHLSHNALLKSLPVVTAFWFLWWKEDDDWVRRRSILLMGMLGCFIAMAVVRGLTKVLPFRMRPIADPDLGLNAVPGMPSADWFERMSSLPSDHAGLFFALAVTLFFVSRPIGAWALFHTAVLIALPRVYLGLHYPSDIVAGGLVGGLIAWALTRRWMVEKVGMPALAKVQAAPAWAYAGLFVATFQMASLFESARSALFFLRHLVR